ncbi:hypothetical protein [Micromonospora pallida]|uniref:hypothetical protein n=1 Tax=Micromonospora pallida TaxID=145854 RepID=UPI00159F172F|nr:hypothetical protein [Micromonospora pallida]
MDVGTTHTKAGVYRLDGTPVAQRRAATPPDAVGLRDTALRLLAECVAAVPVPPLAVGLASMAETGVPLDAAGEPVGELLHWRDRRAHREADQLGETVGRTPFFAATSPTLAALVEVRPTGAATVRVRLRNVGAEPVAATVHWDGPGVTGGGQVRLAGHGVADVTMRRAAPVG